MSCACKFIHLINLIMVRLRASVAKKINIKMKLHPGLYSDVIMHIKIASETGSYRMLPQHCMWFTA